MVLYLITGKSFYREAYLDMHMAKVHHSTHSKVNKTRLFWVALSKCVDRCIMLQYLEAIKSYLIHEREPKGKCKASRKSN